MEEPQARIHADHPFATPLELREPVRRLRGRLSLPVTVWTAGAPGSYAGLTVSSLLVAEGDPSLVVGLISPTTDLYEEILSTEAFVVHVIEFGSHTLADRFAGLRPSPGGLFADLKILPSQWGPVLERFPDRAYCSFESAGELGFQLLVQGRIERIELAEHTDPLTYLRGRYRRLEPE